MMFGTQGLSVVEGVKPLRGNGTFWDCITVLDVKKGLVGGELTLLDGLGEQAKCSCSCSGDLFEQAEDISLILQGIHPSPSGQLES